MKVISGKINLNTLGYSNMRVYIHFVVEMDIETKIDFEDNIEGFLADCKNSDEYFKSEVIHNYLNNRESKTYLVKPN